MPFLYTPTGASAVFGRRSGAQLYLICYIMTHQWFRVTQTIELWRFSIWCRLCPGPLICWNRSMSSMIAMLFPYSLETLSLCHRFARRRQNCIRNLFWILAPMNGNTTELEIDFGFGVILNEFNFNRKQIAWKYSWSEDLVTKLRIDFQSGSGQE